MIRCWFFRHSIRRTIDDSRPPSDELESHLAACPGCRDFHETEVSLVRRLHQGAEEREKEIPVFLHAKIMARIPRDTFGPAPARVSRYPVWGTPAIAAVVLSIGFLAISLKYGAGRVAQSKLDPSPTMEPGMEQRMATSSPDLPLRLPPAEGLRQWTERLDQPLEKELHAMLQDAQSAIHLLAHNFLPEKALQ